MLPLTSNLNPIYSKDREPRWTRREVLAEIWENGHTKHERLIEYWYSEDNGTAEVECYKPELDFIADGLTEDILCAITIDLNVRKINLIII